ncbi:Uncharacterised protein [Bordetella pertussis]|nr:Uncharacterised protein [Bordetella pertussis]
MCTRPNCRLIAVISGRSSAGTSPSGRGARSSGSRCWTARPTRSRRRMARSIASRMLRARNRNSRAEAFRLAPSHCRMSPRRAASEWPACACIRPSASVTL